MAILTETGRTELTKYIASTQIYLGWGRGDPLWQSTPPEGSVDQFELEDIVGYRKAKQIKYCQPDNNGIISVPHGQYSLSKTPTHHLFCEFSFDFEDALGETIRELGLMVGTQAKVNVPSGKHYLLPEEVENKGTLLLVENRLPLFRDQGVRETFEFVITF